MQGASIPEGRFGISVHIPSAKRRILKCVKMKNDQRLSSDKVAMVKKKNPNNA
jgi:hypothetical protein